MTVAEDDEEALGSRTAPREMLAKASRFAEINNILTDLFSRFQLKTGILRCLRFQRSTIKVR